MVDLARQVWAKWGDSPVDSFDFTLSKGLEPSIANFNLCTTKDVDLEQTLTFSDGFNGVLTFPNCRAIEGESTRDGENNRKGMIRVRDRRWMFQSNVISGTYNLRDTNNQLVTVSKKSLRELVDLCLDALGIKSETSNGVKESTDDIYYPETLWNYSLGTRALSDLLDEYNYEFLLKTNNTFQIVAKNSGSVSFLDTDKYKSPMFADSFKVEDLDIPSKLTIVLGRSRCQIKDIALTPVALDLVNDEETIVPIDDASYKPSGGWQTGTHHSLFISGQKEKAELCKISVFRYYQLPETLSIDGESVARDIYITRILPDLVEVSVDSKTGQKGKRKRFVSGKHYVGKDMSSPYSFKPDDDDIVSDATFDIDKKRGLVKFSKSVYWKSENKLVNPTLKLTAAFIGSEKISADREHELTISHKRAIPNKTRYIPYFDICKELKDGEVQNQDDIDKALNDVSEIEMAPYQSIDRPFTRSIIGTQNIDLSGIMNQVTWTISTSNGAETIVSVGCTHDLRVCKERDKKIQRYMMAVYDNDIEESGYDDSEDVDGED